MSENSQVKKFSNITSQIKNKQRRSETYHRLKKQKQKEKHKEREKRKRENEETNDEVDFIL